MGAIARQPGFGQLEGNSVNVQPVSPIDTCGGGQRIHMQILKRSEIEKIEDRTQVYIEPLGTLSRKHRLASG